MKSKSERNSYNGYKFTILGESVVSDHVTSSLLVIDELSFMLEINTSASNNAAIHRLGSF